MPQNLSAAARAIFDTRLTLRRYTIHSGKIASPVRLVFLSDLHDCRYGPGQRELVNAIAEQKPHLVLMGGDMADTRGRHKNALMLMAALGRRYPCYYVSGNHEVDSGMLPALQEMFRHCGVHILQGCCHKISLAGPPLLLCGVDDPKVNRTRHLKQVDAATPKDGALFSILLAHRPELAPYYATRRYNLIFAGHAHGGQWRIPGVMNGFYAPDQGLFPKYAGGLYRLQNSALIVGRGLARNHVLVPRVFNPPELVAVELLPKSRHT